MSMAHECPDCGQLCYCNGDIDDCILNDDDAVLRCEHCEHCEHYRECGRSDGFDDEEFDDDFFRDEDDGHEQAGKEGKE